MLTGYRQSGIGMLIAVQVLAAASTAGTRFWISAAPTGSETATGSASASGWKTPSTRNMLLHWAVAIWTSTAVRIPMRTWVRHRPSTSPTGTGSSPIAV